MDNSGLAYQFLDVYSRRNANDFSPPAYATLSPESPAGQLVHRLTRFLRAVRVLSQKLLWRRQLRGPTAFVMPQECELSPFTQRPKYATAPFLQALVGIYPIARSFAKWLWPDAS